MKALNRRLVETPVGILDVQFARRFPQHEEPRETNTLWFENFDPRTTDNVSLSVVLLILAFDM
jgi:hypothetical protein